MNEERAGREGSSRDSGGSWDAFGAAGGSSSADPGAVPRQAEQGRAVGAGRRRAAGPAGSEFGAGELTAALQRSVSAVGASGPPRAGLTRIRRRAKARQRRRTVMAGSAGVLLLAMGVAAVTGSSFDIVPVLTGVVGLGGGSTSSGATSSAPNSGGSGQVRTVRPPAAAAGKKGPAIGPLTSSASASASTSTALAATGVAQCTAADLTVTGGVDSVIGGVSYGHIKAVATTTCAVAGPPVLQVENAAGTAAGTVVILRHETSDGSQLPSVSTWGAVLKLQAGQGYDLQFAWAPDACAGSGTNNGADNASTTSAASGGSSVAASSGSGSAGGAAAANQSAESTYSLSYLVAGVTPVQPVPLAATCGATVYVTDIYGEGAYPLPQPPASPTPAPSTSSAPAPSASPTTQPVPSGTSAASSSASPAAPSSSATSSSAAATASSGAATTGAANATAAADPSSS